MTERPILFSTPMVRALLDGSKTQTRRIAKPRKKPSLLDGTWADSYVLDEGNREWLMRGCPYGAVGDRLWVRETFARVPTTAYRASVGVNQTVNASDPYESAIYRACFDRSAGGVAWKPSIHMPRWASRITLEITDVRVQRLQELSAEDAIAEGVVWSEPTEADREWMRGRAEEEGSDLRDLDGVWLAPGTRQGYGPPHLRDEPRWAPTARGAYRWVWESINGAGAWDANPWVWAISFTRLRATSGGR